MQTTTTLPFPLNPTGAAQSATARARGNGAADDGGQFGALFSNELAQASAPPPAPAAPAPSANANPAAAKPAQAARPTQSDDPATPQSDATSSGVQGTDKAPASADATAKVDQADDKTADQTATDAQSNADPASAMLALMASLQHGAKPVAVAAGAKTDAAADALKGGAGKGKLVDAGQLAALQAAAKAGGKDGAADAIDAKADAKGKLAAASRDTAFDAKDAARVTDDKAAADTAGAKDVSALLGGAARLDDKTALDAANLSLQQARDAVRAAQDTAAPAATALSALAQTAQPAALDAAQAANAADTLSAQVGTDAWEDQVGQKVVYMVGNEEQTASLTLNPPDLGPMQVVLSVTNDQASVTFSSNQQEVRQALEDALPRLREMMSQSGIALGNATVDAGTQQQQARQDAPARGGRNYGGSGNDGATTVEAAAPRVTRVLRGDNGMVDTFA